MTKADQREAAQVLRRVVEGIDRGEVNAPAWYRERLVGAMLVLDDPRHRVTAWHWALRRRKGQ